MSDAHDTDTHAADHHVDELPPEPDDVPVRSLTIMAAAVTAITLGLIFTAVFLFDAEKAAQLDEKGWTTDRVVMADAGDEATEDAAPADEAPADEAPADEAPADEDGAEAPADEGGAEAPAEEGGEAE